MAKLLLTEGQRSDLEHLLQRGYDELSTYVQTGEQATRLNTINVLYQAAYDALSNMFGVGSASFRRLRKGGKRSAPLEGFIYQTILMVDRSAAAIDTFSLNIEENPNDGMGGLRAYVDIAAKDIPLPGVGTRKAETTDDDTPKGELFRRTQLKAAQLRKQGEYGSILNAMKYVRESYSPTTAR